jgi:pimeloyl-ACP methyl ester carboxylesterase
MRVHSHTADTDRLRMHYLEAGPEDGIPVVLVHGNLSTGRFFEHVMSGAPDRFRVIAPDMRGFGDTEFAPIDATRGCATGPAPAAARPARSSRSDWPRATARRSRPRRRAT